MTRLLKYFIVGVLIAVLVPFGFAPVWAYTITEGSLFTSYNLDFKPIYDLQTPGGRLHGASPGAERFEPSQLDSLASPSLSGLKEIGEPFDLDSTWILRSMNRLPDGGFQIGRLSFDTAETVMTTGVLTADGLLVPSGGVLGVPFTMTGVLFGDTVNGIGLASAGLVGGTILSVGYVFAAAPPGGPAIPEPGTWLLLMSGLGTLALWRYRQSCPQAAAPVL